MTIPAISRLMRAPRAAIGCLVSLALLFSAVSCRSASFPPQAPSTPAQTTNYPARIVSLVPSVTELLYEVGAGSALVGVTVNDTFPPQVEKLPKVGDQTIDPERLLSLKPDLVVLDSEFNKDQETFQRLGLNVLALRSKRLSDIGDNLRVLGRRLGHEQNGMKAAERFEKALKEIPRSNSQQRVLVEIWGSPLMTVGAETLPDDLLQEMGLTNAYADQKGYFQVDPEDVVTRRPGIVILPAAKLTDHSVAAGLLRKAGVPVKVIVLDGDTFTNPTPRVLQGLRKISNELSSVD